MHVNCLDQGFKWFARHLAWELQRIVFTEFNAGFGGWCLLVIYSIFTFYTFGFHSSSNVGCDRGITRKHRKPEALWSPRKVFVATQRQCWWEAYTGTTHHQQLQLVTVIEERKIIEEKRGICKKDQTFFSDLIKKLDEDAQRSSKAMQIVSKQVMKCPDTIFN